MTLCPATEAAKIAKEIEAIDFSLNLQKNSIVSHGWIIVDAKDQTSAYGFETTYNNETGRYDVHSPAWKAPHKANRLTEQDARRVAPSFQNGNGPCRAVHWMDAATEHRARLVEVQALWEEMAAKAA